MKAIQTLLYMILGGVLLTGILIGISYAKPGFSRKLHDSLPTSEAAEISSSEALLPTVQVETTPPAGETVTSTEDRGHMVSGITASVTPFENSSTSTTVRPAATWGEQPATTQSSSTETSTTTVTQSSSSSVSAAPASSSSTSSTSTTTTSTVSPVLIYYGYDESDVIKTRAEYYEAAKKHIEAYIGNPISFTTLVKGLPVVRQIETAYDNESYKEGFANDVVKDLKVKGVNISVSSQAIGDDYYVISHAVVLGEKESTSSSSSTSTSTS
ncbi:MAG: hypothetical protein K6E33_03260 [Lachnospiraceae bacterium]|nr:hypothetical protein [Lachnospiraceae bacterium]